MTQVSATDFVDVLHHLGDGTTDQELSEELRDLCVRVLQTRKKGTLTLQLSVEIADGHAVVPSRVTIIDKITVRKPEFARPTRDFLVDEAGRLEDAGVQGELLPADQARDVVRTLRHVGVDEVSVDGVTVDMRTGEIVGSLR